MCSIPHAYTGMPRLESAHLSQTCSVQKLGQLRRLATACLADQHERLVRLDQTDQLLARFCNGQLFLGFLIAIAAQSFEVLTIPSHQSQT